MYKNNEIELKEIVEKAYQTEFYKTLYDMEHIDMSSFKFEELPFVTQKDLILNWEKFKNNKKDIFRLSASSGTSNHPKVVFRTKLDFETSAKVMEEMMRAIGISKEDVVYIGQPFDLASFGYLVLEGCKQIGALAIPGGLGQSNEKMLEIIDWGKATVIMSSPSRMKKLMDILEEDDKKLLRERIVNKIMKIIVAGEPLRKEEKVSLQKFWKCEVYDYYGSEETDSLGYSKCDEYITLMERYFKFEYIELPNTNKYELVITSLYLEGTPLIRYKLGDVVERNEKGQIKIVGKIYDVLYLYDGIKLYAFQIEDAIYSVLKREFKFQIVCKNIEGIDVINVLIDAEMGENYKEENIEMTIAEAIWNASLDLEVCNSMKNLKIFVKLNSGEILMTRRGKTPKIIDERR